MGVVTVCVSLLSNEHMVLQEYSCSIIANLLVWECRGRNPDWVEKSVRKFLINLNGHSLTYLLTQSLTHLLFYSLRDQDPNCQVDQPECVCEAVEFLWRLKPEIGGGSADEPDVVAGDLLTHSLTLTYLLTYSTY